ncbi:hypothetical protein BS78_K087900 [Paspalum vaginatum]|uniref:Secreted protein n=1 Tax=Paspalum vaginatum TaxID=158149 RepID=A0A9W8CFC3_9POAL|nr:hypothetical protein BS78_K087900 [Paspalum vaginatum]KAJ1256075.1 hypothetical protein BS78_K087900 [Paspalum vaginatum]
MKNLSSLPAMSYVLMIIQAIVISCSVVHCDSPVHDTTEARQGSAPPTPLGAPLIHYSTVPPPPQRRRLLHITGSPEGGLELVLTSSMISVGGDDHSL